MALRNGMTGRAALLVGVSLFGAVPADAGPGRFFASVAQCEHAGALGAGACRTAFANALAEFAAKAPSFSSRRACFRTFGPCMPWPMGTHRFNEFRPQWIGVSVDETTVVPAVAPGRQHFAFAPQSTASLSTAAAATPAPVQAGAAGSPDVKILTPDDEGGDAAGPPSGRVGGGFTMIDGVLTYPAPARFQPKVLKRP